MSSAKAALEVVVDHRVAAVLDHDDLRRGSARATAAPRPASAALAEARRSGPSVASVAEVGHERVRAVLVDVGVGQVVGPDGGASASPALRSTIDVHLAAGEVDQRRGPRPAPPARQTQTPFIATSSVGGVEGGRGGADRGEHPAPVGVVAEDRALEQVAAGDAAGDLDGVVLGRPRRRTVDRDVVVGALGVGEQLQGEVGADLRSRASVKSAGAGVTPRGAARPAATTVSLVDMQPSESSRSKRDPGRRRAAPCRASAGVDDGVGGEHDEHRGQRRREHAGALGHPADRPAVALRRRPVLADGVGGHDRARRRRRRRRRTGRAAAASTPASSRSIGEQLSRSGRSSRRATSTGADRRARPATCSAVRVGGLEALRRRCSVGAAGVEHDRVDAGRRRRPARSRAPGWPCTGCW